MGFKDTMSGVWEKVFGKVKENVVPVVIAIATPALKEALSAVTAKVLVIAREGATNYYVKAKSTPEWWDDILGAGMCAMLGCDKEEVHAAADAAKGPVKISMNLSPDRDVIA